MINMSRKSFASDLHEIIRESRIRQNIIAQALGLSSAAISQFIHGIVLPKPEQLEDILTLLCVSDEERSAMQERLAALREECGEEDIPELDPALINSDDEEEDDNNTFEESIDFIFRDSGENDFEQPENIPDLSIPVLQLSDLKYIKKSALCDFACMYSQDIILRDYGAIEIAALIKGTGDQLGLEYHGMVQMVVIDEKSPHKNIASTALAIYRGNTFRLIPLVKSETNAGLTSFFAPVKAGAKPQRVFPILELTLLPLTVPAVATNSGF